MSLYILGLYVFDTANRGSTLNLKITNWENTPILKLNGVELFVNSKRRQILFQLQLIFALTLSTA